MIAYERANSVLKKVAKRNSSNIIFNGVSGNFILCTSDDNKSHKYIANLNDEIDILKQQITYKRQQIATIAFTSVELRNGYLYLSFKIKIIQKMSSSMDNPNPRTGPNIQFNFARK